MRHLESIPADSRSREKGSRLPRPAPASVEAPPARFPRSLPAFGTGSRFVQAGPTGVPGSARGGPCEAAIRMQEGGSGKLIFLT